MAGALECQAEVEITSITPAAVNEAGITQRVQETARRLWPNSPVDTEQRSMASEDMAFMMGEIPGCYIFLGSANVEKGLSAPHHHPRFNIDEDALPRAAAIISAAVAALMEL